MVFRFIDPKKIKIESPCFEISEEYIGEVVSGKKIRAFEVVIPEKVEKPGVEIHGELKESLGIVVKAEVEEEVAMSLESLIPEIVNRIKGVRYDFRKDKAQITVSTERADFVSCLGELIFHAFKSIGIRCRVLLITDETFYEWLERARKIYARRQFTQSDEDVNIFYGCKSCQFSLPNHICIITPERPSPCGTSYIEAKAAEKLSIVGYYFPVRKGTKVGVDEYSGVNEILNKETDGTINRAKIHSVLEYPLLTGLYSQIIIFYIPEDGFGIVDREYKGKTPIGLTFNDMEKLILGKQVPGFVGESFAYLKSRKFLAGEGGWKKVVWMSDNVKNFISQK